MLIYKTFDDFVVLFITPLEITNIGCGTPDLADSMVVIVLQATILSLHAL